LVITQLSETLGSRIRRTKQAAQYNTLALLPQMQPSMLVMNDADRSCLTMSKSVVAIVVLMLSLSPCLAQTAHSQTDSTMTIKQLDRELERALLKNDTVTLDRILADDYFEIDAQGGIKNKAEVIELARAHGAVPRSVMVGPETSVDDLTIRIHGDSALVVGRTTIRYQFMENQVLSPDAQSQTPANIHQERFSRTYAKVGPRWQLVAWQTTAIAKR
jgi:hypothetical protein